MAILASIARVTREGLPVIDLIATSAAATKRLSDLAGLGFVAFSRDTGPLIVFLTDPAYQAFDSRGFFAYLPGDYDPTRREI